MNPVYQSAISPCPNDIFIFSGILSGQCQWPDELKNFTFLDIQELNSRAMLQKAGLIKVSFAAMSKLSEHYTMLESGAAMGFGCGPLVLSRKNEPIQAGMRIGIPGWQTTAWLLFRRYFSHIISHNKDQIKQIVFHDLENALLNHEIDLALIIHETRFSYDQNQLTKVSDLGELWEKETSLPIPLGGICLHRSLLHLKSQVEEGILQSLDFAQANQDKAIALCREYAQDMDPEVIRSHINLYVNSFSYQIGENGHRALTLLRDGINS